MKQPYKIIQHPNFPSGYHLIFPKHTWSCVNLSMPDFGTPSNIREHLGQIYDTMGGRFEAMIVTKKSVNPDHQLRANSFEELFKKVEKYEKKFNSK